MQLLYNSEICTIERIKICEVQESIVIIVQRPDFE